MMTNNKKDNHLMTSGPSRV
uniref:Uncharacterized protein n=1 Tax=Arundo donax TaxID=35708 RepID=A0A0A9EPQ0_ARUDO